MEDMTQGPEMKDIRDTGDLKLPIFSAGIHSIQNPIQLHLWAMDLSLPLPCIMSEIMARRLS